MDQSIDAAVYVALTRLGYEVGFTARGSPSSRWWPTRRPTGAAGGRRDHRIEGTPVATSDDASNEIRSHAVGTPSAWSAPAMGSL